MSFWQAEARFDWGSYVRKKGGMRSLAHQSSEYLMECPDCHKPKLAVNVERRAWQCFVCSDSGRDAASLIAKVEQVRFGEALLTVMDGHRRSAGRIDVIEQALDVNDGQSRLAWIPKVVPWPDGWAWLCPYERDSGPVHRRAVTYAQERRWPEYAAEALHLGVCDRGRMRGRIVFPAFDSGGRLIFYQGRATWTPDPRGRHIKTLSPRRETEDQAGPADCLLNWMTVVKESFERVLIVEGPTDCIRAWPDAVATFGKQISARQMELLIRAGVKHVDLCWDNDEIKPAARKRGVISGYEAAMKVAPVLADLFEVRVVTLPPGQDPGDLTKAEIEGYRARAQRWGSGDRLSRIPDTV